jgi:hypothetical protein
MFSTHQRLNVKHASDSIYPLPSKDFCNWLAGVTDGDGSFSFSVNKERNSIWNCTFKIAQSTYNCRLLYFIKGNLQYGSVNKKAGKNMAEFRIRDREILIHLVVPLFTQYPLYSTKHFYFLRWVKALQVLESKRWTTAEKNEILTKLKSQLPPDTYVSSAWERDYPTNEWVYGFVEAEASLFITCKGSCHQSLATAKTNSLANLHLVTTNYKTQGTTVNDLLPIEDWLKVEKPLKIASHFLSQLDCLKVYLSNTSDFKAIDACQLGRIEIKSEDVVKRDRLVHAFGVTQKLDRIILEFLRRKFHISSKVLHTKRDVYKLETTNSRSILRIKTFLFKKLKGVKSLEYKIWSRSLNFKGDIGKLSRAQSLLRKIRAAYKQCQGF